MGSIAVKARNGIRKGMGRTGKASEAGVGRDAARITAGATGCHLSARGRPRTRFALHKRKKALSIGSVGLSYRK